MNEYLLILFGSTILWSVGSSGVVACRELNPSDLHELSSSSGSLLGCTCIWWRWSDGPSSLMLLWSDGDDGFEHDMVGPPTTTSSLNMDISWSSSNLSKSWPALWWWLPPAEDLRHSSTMGASRKAMESLIDLLWDPRRDDEKSKNSSTQDEPWWLFNPPSIFKSGQFGVVMLGTFGGNWAMVLKYNPHPHYNVMYINWTKL